MLRTQNAIMENNDQQVELNAALLNTTADSIRRLNEMVAATNHVRRGEDQLRTLAGLMHRIRLKEDVSELVRACQRAKGGIVNSNLLNKDEVNQLLRETDMLPYNNAIEAMQYSKPSVYSNGTALVYALLLPKVKSEVFSQLIVRSPVKDGRRIQLAYNNILTNKAETYGNKQPCLHLEAATVCGDDVLEAIPESDCIARLIKGGEASCRYAVFNRSTLEVIKGDTLFLDNFSGTLVTPTSTLELNGSYLLQLYNESVTINGEKYRSTSASGVQLLPPVLAFVSNGSTLLDVNLVHEMATRNIRLLQHIKGRTLGLAAWEIFTATLLVIVFVVLWRKLTRSANIPRLNVSVLTRSGRAPPGRAPPPDNLRNADF